MKTYSRRKPITFKSFSGICRLCLSQHDDRRYIYNSGGDIPLCVKIMTCIPIQLSEGDGFPSEICHSCICQVEKSYKFRRKCEEADQKLRSLLNTTNKHVVEDQQTFEKNAGIKMKTSSVTILQRTTAKSLEPFGSFLTNSCTTDAKSAVNPPANTTFVTDSLRSEAVKAKLTSICCDSDNFLDNVPHIRKTHENVFNEFKLGNDNFCQISACQSEYESFNGSGDYSQVDHSVYNSPQHIQQTEKQPDSHLVEKLQSAAKSQIEHQNSTTVSLGTVVPNYSESPTPDLPQDRAQFSQCPETLLKEKCSAFFTDKNGNTTHSLLIFKCDKCPKRFSKRLDLKRHNSVHSQQRGFVCQICEKWCHNLSNFKRHQRTHTGERPFPCTYCSKRFSQTAILKRHIMIHTGEKPFECDGCGKKFNQKERLRVHTRQHLSSSDATYHKCSFCEKSFCYKSGLSRHLATHTGKKFSCSGCSKTYTDKSTMKRHLKRHIEEIHQ